MTGPILRDTILSYAAALQNFNGRSNGGFATPDNVSLVSQNPRLWRVVDVLHEQGIALPWGKQADCLGGDRPLRQPLHDRTEAIGPAKNEMIAVSLRQRYFNGGAPARHLRIRKPRIFGSYDTRKSGRNRHEAFFGSATIISSSTRAPGDDN